MSLPRTVLVRISSENAESIGLSPVVAHDMPLEELVRYMLGVTGKDAARIREILSRGSLVSGASRFRWTGFDVMESEVATHLTGYPDPDPSIPFAPEACYLMTLHFSGRQIALEREAGEKRRMFRRRSFWEEALAAISSPAYSGYSYRECADIYRWKPDADSQERLREAAKLLAYTSFEAQLRSAPVDAIDLYVKRSDTL